ncbi:MAG: DUF2256 domain-containing protein [Pseudorhodobacter sp.]|nr:DUF2256 domain-containing protein [Rhizobacter sp.]
MRQVAEQYPRAQTADSHKGNKSKLPSKDCVQCGRPMAWRKSWAKNWADVKYCSDRCRAAPRGTKAI